MRLPFKPATFTRIPVDELRPNQDVARAEILFDEADAAGHDVRTSEDVDARRPTK